MARDVLSTYTSASLIEDETTESLRTALVINTSPLRNNPCTIRVDTAPGFQGLRNDATLNSIGITIDFGRIKNKDSNSVVDKGIQELEQEILKHDPSGSPLTSLQLQMIVDTLNTRVRNRGLSAKEIILKRDQFTQQTINVKDKMLSEQQTDIRTKNHIPSSRSKATAISKASDAPVVEGDLVYIKSEKQKNKTRDRYIVTGLNNNKALLQKLNDKFMSRQYEVPLTHIYPALPTKTYHDWDRRPVMWSSEESSDEEVATPNSEVHDSDSAGDELADEEDEEEQEEEHIPVWRPQRQRRPPQWLHSGDYDLQQWLYVRRT